MKYKKYILAIAGTLSLLQCITGYGGTGSGKAATVASKVVRQWVLGD